MRVTTKGQVTIPIDIREKLGLLPDTEVTFEIDGNAARIRKATSTARPSRGASLIDHLRGRATRGMTTDQIMRLTRG
jgi:AbrB family looped-hinge helix DNA binding protein